MGKGKRRLVSITLAVSTVWGCAPSEKRPDRGPEKLGVVTQPVTTPTGLKGIHPAGDSANPATNDAVISEGHAERVGMALVWDWWEPYHKPAPCTSPQSHEFKGYCYAVRAPDDAAIKKYAAAGIKITAAVFGTPKWAGREQCAQYQAMSTEGGHWWCAPKDPADYARFAGFLVDHYGHQIDSFVIGNEVNAAVWYDIGCTGPHGSFASCLNNQAWMNDWAQNYANLYNAAYDEIKSEHSAAHVLIPTTNGFFSQTGVTQTSRVIYSKNPSLTWIKTFAQWTGDGQWLSVGLTEPYLNVRHVRVHTAQSSSWVGWKEIHAMENGINHAKNKPVTVSTSPGTAPLAVDENSGTAWNSGQGAPGWIQVDLGADQRLQNIWLQTAQSPAGNTLHYVYVDSTRYQINDFPHVPAQTFLQNVIPRLGSRDWHITFHPYNEPFWNTTFSPEDTGLTFGNIGAAVGWLQKTYGMVPGAKEVHLGEFGFSSNYNAASPLSTEATQASLVCDSLRNALATPGIHSYLYFHLKDPGFNSIGLWRADGTRKPAWWEWANANVTPSCGFEVWPYTQLRRWFHPQNSRHWQSTRVRAPSGFVYEGVIARLEREPKPGTRLLYECRTVFDLHNLISMGADCENQKPLGPIGYAYTSQLPGTVGLVRCSISGGWNHYVTTGSTNACGPHTYEGTLGYVYPP